ncbi:MAG: hypothetical protein GKR91_02820 [Pseudomonadales bacterium]|nr:hypothetical protein [Pseudomonadales bacterium]
MNRIFSAIIVFCCSASVFGQSLTVSVTSNEGEPIPGAVIEILLPDELKSAYGETTSNQVDQIDKEFVPTITTAVAGSQISFPNSDDILHHVYSFSPAKTFNIPLYGRRENNDFVETFETPGVVEIGCNIHDWMLAYIYIGETSLVAISDDSGIAQLDSLPEGEFELSIWHPRLAESSGSTQTITVTGTASLDLQIELELVRDRRVRRAPSANRNRYR